MTSIKLFLCHSSKDKPFVRKLRDELKAHLHDPWLDENEIKVGDSIFESVQKGLSTSDFVLLILSPNFMESRWAQRELAATFQQEMKIKKKRILPCLIQDTDIPHLIADIKYADFKTDFNAGLSSILNTITPEDRNTMDVYVTDALVVLDILNDDGSLVSYTKRSVHISQIDNLDIFNDCLSVAGKITNLKVEGATVAKEWQESGFTFFALRYPRLLKINDRLPLVTTAMFLDSFTKNEEYWETLTNNHNADKFKVLVKFPKTRPPKTWFLEERIGTKYFNAGTKAISFFVADERFNLALEVEHPVNHTTYLLRWTW